MPDGGIPPLAFTTAGPVVTFEASGDWTIAEGRTLASAIASVSDQMSAAAGKHAIFDLGHVHKLDTSGSFLIHRLITSASDKGLSHEFRNTSDERQQLIQRVAAADFTALSEQSSDLTLTDMVAELGESVSIAVEDVVDAMTVFGRIMAGLASAVAGPGRVRLASVVHHIEHTGLRAVPIVALMSFLIGAIIAQQGAFQLRSFGAEIFTVDLVGILVLREIGVLLTAIMVAGRSGSAFTAEIGSMRMREEVDALKIIGLDPIEVLALPRVMALMISLPLLTFIANMSAILGAMVVGFIYSDIQPTIFVDRLREAAEVSTFTVGFIKAPVMALIIGLVACVEGFRVEGSTESLGQHTTAAVVKSIFMVIVLDGIFAIFFAAVDF